MKTRLSRASSAPQGRGIEKGDGDQVHGPSAIQGSGWNSWRRFLLFSSLKKRVNRLEAGSPSYLVWLVRNNHRLPGPLLVFSPSPSGTTEPARQRRTMVPCFLPSALVITADRQQPEGDLNVSRDLPRVRRTLPPLSNLFTTLPCFCSASFDPAIFQRDFRATSIASTSAPLSEERWSLLVDTRPIGVTLFFCACVVAEKLESLSSFSLERLPYLSFPLLII